MIFYFSGTGNSKYIANRLKEGLNDKEVSINDLLKNNIKDEIDVNGNLILVAPSYFMHMPLVVEEWFKNTKFNNVNGVYFFLTYYSEYGSAKIRNRKLAEYNGFKYMGTTIVNMPNNHITMYKTSTIIESKELIKKADSLIDSIIPLIKENKEIVEYKSKFTDSLMTNVVSPILTKTMISAKGFYAKDNCIGCSICVNKCPLNNIKLVDKKPLWGNNCTHCLACISYCPNEAIEFKNKTIGKFRYNIEKVIK